MKQSYSIRITLSFVTLLTFGALAADDGRIELNQASIEAAGGFPYTINDPGSYVLTGPLSVPASTNGLIVAANRVSIDLNGFAISSSAECSRASCVPGTGEGISRTATSGHFATVHNGGVFNFANNCIRLGTGARVYDLAIFSCSQAGMVTGESGVITRNSVRSTGIQGLVIGGTAAYSHNTIAESGLAGGDESAVMGGYATAGNSCQDTSCRSMDARRWFYLATPAVQGDGALTACDAGFHMASMFELNDPTVLRYDTERGLVRDDSGRGPPSNLYGWVRTGSPEFTGNSVGLANCLAWQSADGEDYGMVTRLGINWSDTGENTSPWHGRTLTCDGFNYVWCIQN